MAIAPDAWHLQPKPAQWKKTKGKTVTLLNLVHDPKSIKRDGWLTYAKGLTGFPDVEVIGGGLNPRKDPHVGLWRQANILHFGFDLRPGQMTVAGKQLLVNASFTSARSEITGLLLDLTTTKSWFSRVRPFRTVDRMGLLTVDAVAREWQVRFDGLGFFPALFSRLESKGEEGTKALSLLAEKRYMRISGN